MGKIITFLILISISPIVFSQSYELKLNFNNGTSSSFHIENIKYITFSGITEIKVDKKMNTIISSLKLFQNYPNPFNPKTSINYYLPKPGSVEIRIFDINGSQVRNILIPNQTEGLHEYVWNAKSNLENNVSSGLYIYQIKFEGQILSKKMILIK